MTLPAKITRLLGTGSMVVVLFVGTCSVATSASATPVTPVPPITVGAGPAGVLFSPDSMRAWVANFTAGTLSVVDVSTHSAIGAPMLLGLGANQIALANGGTHVLVTATDTGRLHIMDSLRLSALTPPVSVGKPTSLAVSPDSRVAYVADAGANKIRVVDLTSFTLRSESIAVPSGPSDLVLSEDGKRLYVASRGSDVVTVLDTASRTTAATIHTGIDSAPTLMALVPGGGQLLVTAQGRDAVIVVDTASLSVEDTVPVGAAPTGIDVTADGSTAYVVNSGDDSVSILDLMTGSSTETPLPSGAGANQIALSPDGRWAYITNSFDGTVSVLALKARTTTVVG